MLVSVIKEDNKKCYYVELINKKKKLLYNITCFDGVKNYILTEFEAKKLIRNMFNSTLKYLKNENEYEVYVDEMNNKRYFKNQVENISLFYENNGINTVLYNKTDNEGNDNKEETSKIFTLKGAKYIYTFLLGSSIGLFALTVKNFGCPVIYDYDITYNNGINIDVDYHYPKFIIEANKSQPLTVEEIEESISSSKGKNMDKLIKQSMINEQLFNDVLSTIDPSRNYILRRKLKNININFYDNHDESEKDILGFYSTKDINALNIRSEFKDSEYFFILFHEFIHLLQDDNKYKYIKEASAEIIKDEYYNVTATSYIEERKRLYILMELIGPKAVFECNFKGDTSSFEKAIYNVLEKEDADNFLELLTKFSRNDEKQKLINSAIDLYLAKMYKNLYNEDIKTNKFINYIYYFDKDSDVTDINVFFSTSNPNIHFDRAYFNTSNEYYDRPFYKIINIINRKSDIRSIEGTNYKIICERKFITSLDKLTLPQLDFLDNKRTEENKNISSIDFSSYILKDGYVEQKGKIVNLKSGKMFSYKEAFKKKIIQNAEYIVTEKYEYYSIDDFLDADINYTTCKVYRDGIYLGYIEPSNESIIHKEVKGSIFEESIAKKFNEDENSFDSYKRKLLMK